MAKRVIEKEDVLRFQWPGNPTLSPDGRHVIYTRTWAREKEDDYETQLVIADAESGAWRFLTSTGSRNTSPVWSPNSSRIAFLSNRGYGTQAWILSLEGGEAQRVTKFRYGISSLVFSPDGQTLYGLVPCVSGEGVETFADDVTEKEAKEQTDKADESWRTGPKRFDNIYYKRDGGGLRRGTKQQLVAVDLGTGAHRQLTEGPYDVGEASVSPDGRFLVFTSNRRENPEVELASDLYKVAAEGGDFVLLCNEVNASQPTVSPDGQTIAFFGHRDEYKSATQTRLFTIPSEGGEWVDLAAEFPDGLGDSGMSDMRSHEHTPGPVWSKDGKYLYALSSREGRTELVQFSRQSGATEAKVIIGGDREIYGFSGNGSDTFVIAYTTPAHPGKVAVVNIENGPTTSRPDRDVAQPMHQSPVSFFPNREVRVDDCSDALLSERIVVEPQVFWYTSQDDWQCQGFVLKPAEAKPGHKYPVILEVHGGPHANFSYSFFHEMQWFAAQGYAVVYVNPRGSTSYGQTFKDGVREHYGEGDAADVLNGLDAALNQFDFLDASRVALTGGSYGGFMTNWLVGHTDRFFAAVSQRSISNWISFYGVSDIGPSFTERQVGADVKTGFETLWKHSPLRYVGNVKTPLLLLHSENDLRCPIEQAEQFYISIKRHGGEVELLRIPNASHDLSRTGKPGLRLERLQAIFGFIDDRLPNKAVSSNA